MAYLRYWTVLAIVLALLVEFALLKKYLKDDQGIMGMFTSWFGPCVVKDHYTKFMLKTSLSTTVTYIVAIYLLFALVQMEILVPPIQSFPPIIQCFKVSDWIPTTNQIRCCYNGTIVQNCSSTLISTDSVFPGFVTVCQAGEEVWHRLNHVTLVLAILLLINMASCCFLHWYLNPTNRLKATSCRLWLFDQVWDPEQKDIKEAVVKLVLNHQFSDFKRLNDECMETTKRTLFYRAVEEGNIQLVEILNAECDAYLLDSSENKYNEFNPLVAAARQDRRQVIKLVIAIIKGKGENMYSQQKCNM
jgi:hypothetical protein